MGVVFSVRQRRTDLGWTPHNEYAVGMSFIHIAITDQPSAPFPSVALYFSACLISQLICVQQIPKAQISLLESVEGPTLMSASLHNICSSAMDFWSGKKRS